MSKIKNRRSKCKSTKRHRRKSTKTHRRKSTKKLLKKRRFGSKSSLLDYMGNYRPTSEMSLAQSVVGMSPTQFNNHVKGIPLSVRSNFYTNL